MEQMTPQVTAVGETPSADSPPTSRRGVPGRPFRPGQSGNPLGRPPLPPELVEGARSFTAEALATVVEVMRNAKRAATRLKAAEVVLDRGWGRAPLAVSVELSRRVDLAAVSEAEWEALSTLRHVVRPALPTAPAAEAVVVLHQGDDRRA